MMVNKQIGLVLGTATVVLATNSVNAQLEEVVVTAQKREQNAQDVGIAVTAFGGEQLKSMRISSADKIGDSISGVQVYNYRGKSQPSFVVRGVGTQDYAPNTSPTAAVYIDEVYLGSNIITGFQIFDVERVEVLKGPQGTLFGRNTTGGAVSYTMVRPSAEFEAYVEVGYANYDTAEANFAFGGAVSDGVNMRLSGKLSDQGEGHYKNTFTPDQNPFGPSPNFSNSGSKIGEDSNWALRLLTEIDVSDVATLLLNFHGGERDADTLPVTAIGFVPIDGSGGTCAATATGGDVSDPRFCGDAFGYSDTDGDEFTVSNDFIGHNDEENFGGSARLTWDFDELTFTSITAYESADKVQSADADGSAQAVFHNQYDIGFEQLSQEFRLTSTTQNLVWTTGLYLGYDEIDQVYCGDLNPLIGIGVECRNEFSQKTDNGAVYGQAEYSVVDQLNLTVGLRYTYEGRDFKSVNTLTDENGNVALVNFGLNPEDAAVTDDDVSSSNLSGRIGLDFFLTEDVLLYASYSSGNKSGGYDGDFAFTRQQLDPYDEETIEAYELGWKTTLADGYVRFNGAAFYYDYSDPQMRVQRVSNAGLPFNQLINLDRAEVSGFEADLTWVPTDDLYFSASFALLDTELIEGSSEPALALFDGNELPLAAQESFTLMGKYEFDVTNHLRGVIQLDGKYNGEYELNAENLGWLRQDSYFITNARFSLFDMEGGWEMSVWGKNLGDERFAVGSYSLFGAFPTAFNSPRTYGATLRFDW